MRRSPGCFFAGSVVSSLTVEGGCRMCRLLILLGCALLLLTGCETTSSSLGGGADLEILAGDLLSILAPFTVSQGVTLEAKVRNSGTAAAGEFRIGFYADGHLIGDPLTAVNLDPNEFILAQTAWLPDAARQVRLEVRADILDQVNERREYNNLRLLYVTVRPAPVPEPVADDSAAADVPAENQVAPVADTPANDTAAVVPQPLPVEPVAAVEYVTANETAATAPAGQPDLAITLPDLSYSRAPQVNQELTFSLQVHNLGNGNLPRPAPLLILINGTALPTRANVRTVAPGDLVMVHLPWTPAAEGWAEITVVIDPDGEIAEISKENNIVKRSLYVRP